jgi:hypothetical protein
MKFHLARIINLARLYESVHTVNMRTNVNLADDARQFAELYAYANGLTLGAAITDLIRKAQQAGSTPKEPIQFARTESGFPLLPRTGRRITTEMVLDALNDDTE